MLTYVFDIARRLRLSDNPRHRRSTAVVVAQAGVAVAIAIMLLTLAVTSGFKGKISGTVAEFEGEIAVWPSDERAAELCDSTTANKISALVQRQFNDAGVSGIVTTPVMLKTSDEFEAVELRAYTPQSDLKFIGGMIVDGKADVVDSLTMASVDDFIIISTTTASKLRLKQGDDVGAYFFADGNVKARKVRIGALYNSGFTTYDTSVAFSSKPLIDSVLDVDIDEWTRLNVNGIGLEEIDEAAPFVAGILWQGYYDGSLPGYYSCEPVTNMASQFFNWLQLIDTNVTVIIVLMALIALFTLTATLFILILERTRLIGMLRSIGASNSSIRYIFILLIGRITIMGMLWGNVVALAIIAVQYFTHVFTLNPDAYFISYVPVSMELSHFIVVNVGAIVAALIAMILPSALISRLAPSTTLRFE